ncbi:hypothetical protein E2C01_003843 [Portunus trituberculatus]|uniref:Uncharacterized protein n=1 Tax=Portunus trituberculatus TaxID=210409 RepID=A0A5B7CR94_PORTR|nr:hypothetical protein [Portunus trituberculatus]
MNRQNTLPSVLEGEVKEGVGNLGTTLPTEHIHGVPSDRHREITAGWGAVSGLTDLLPHSVVSLRNERPVEEQIIRYSYPKRNGPHVIESRIPIIPGKYPQLPLVHSSPTSRATAASPQQSDGSVGREECLWRTPCPMTSPSHQSVAVNTASREASASLHLPSANKLITLRHTLPSVHSLKRPKVQRQAFS